MPSPDWRRPNADVLRFQGPLALQMPIKEIPVLPEWTNSDSPYECQIPTGPPGSSNYNYVDVGINTVVEFAAGQQVVVGKAHRRRQPL